MPTPRIRSTQPSEPPLPQHPFPWRGTCRFCHGVVEQASAGEWWLRPGLAGFGGIEECAAAPLMDGGDPGHHVPQVPLSRNGVVPVEMARAAAHWSVQNLITEGEGAR